MHACLWEKYLDKLEKFMSWSLISLNLQYYNHSTQLQSQPSYTKFVVGSKLWSCFSRTIFQPLPEETAKYNCVALSLSIIYTHFFKMIIL